MAAYHLAPPACHREEYQLIGAGHVDCCFFIYIYIYKQQQKYLKRENTFQFERKKAEAQTNRPEPGSSYQSGHRRLYLTI